MTNSRELFICALLFLLKNIYLGGPGRYRAPYRSPSLLLAGCGLRAWYLRHSAAKWSLLSTSSIKLVSSSNDKFKGTLYLCPTLSSKEYISWRPGALSAPLIDPHLHNVTEEHHATSVHDAWSMVTEECNKSCLIVEVIVIVFPPACRISLTFFFCPHSYYFWTS